MGFKCLYARFLSEEITFADHEKKRKKLRIDKI